MTVRRAVEEALDELIEAYGERPVLTSAFGYVSDKTLEKLGDDTYAQLLEAGLKLLKLQQPPHRRQNRKYWG